MRVITGTARGRRLETLPGEATRPTSDAVKEALFSIIQFETEGRSFLDLFAGSGQLGIEALSRGASRAVFVDSAKDAAAVIRKNVTKCGFADRSDVLCTDYRAYLSSSRESFSVILLDPPYSTGMLSDALKNSVRLLKPGGVIICEHPKSELLPESVADCTRHKTYNYGRVALTLYRKAEAEI